MSRIVLVLICLIAIVPACGGDSASSGDTQELEVVAAFYPLAWAAERSGGENVRVRNLTPPGAEPHDVELTPRDVERIRSADVVLYLGAGFQPAVEDAAEGASGTAVDLLRSEELLRSEGDEGEELERDPHVWLDPDRYRGMAERIAQALDRPAPTELLAELRALDEEFTRGLARCRRREVVTSHAAFAYLTRRYGLEQVPISGLSPEAEPAPQDLEQVVEHVRATQATTIFFETLVSPRLAETVARETGATTAVLDPLEGIAQDELDRGADYLSVMRENLASLRRGLECR
jgi:zinc transport system substrate-binding protein